MIVRFALALVLLAPAAAAQSPRLSLDDFARDAGLPGLPGVQAAQTFPAGFYTEEAASGLVVPTDIAFLPDGRMLVAEKRGRVHIVENGVRRLLLNIEPEVLNQHDRGLLGVAVDPAFAVNRRIYLAYTVSVDGSDAQRTDAFSRVTRYALTPAGDVDPASRRVLIGETFATGIPSCYYSHAIGTLAFGSDGTLLVGTGDGASYNTVDTGGLYADCFGPGKFPASEDIGSFRSLLVTSLAGKILRVDPETGLGLPSNPFWTGNPAHNASRVWAMGFRNPFRFSVHTASGSPDPATGNPGTVLYGDVGWGRFEEIGEVRRGENHGWPCYEGSGVQFGVGSYPNSPRGQVMCPPIASAVTAPTFQWSHGDAALSVPAGRTGRTIVGGSVYRGLRYPAAFRGRMFYADYTGGWLASAAVSGAGALSGDGLFSPNTGAIVDVEYDAFTQNLFLVHIAQGRVLRLRHVDGEANNPPVAVATATPVQGRAPLAVSFRGSASSDPDGDGIVYAWTFGDGGLSALADPTHTYTAPGVYTARLTVTDARGASAQATVEVRVAAGTPPTAAIASPAAGASVAAGQTVVLTALASDPDQPASTLAYAWDIALVHDTHEHPNAFAANTASAAYTVPFHGSAGDAYALRVRLTVTDSEGLTATAERTLTISAGGDLDVSFLGTPVALVTAPTGTGSRTLETLRDGMAPAPRPAGSVADAGLQYDTFTGGGPREIDWLGYAFPEAQTFGRVRFTEGLHFPTGGWFETLGVEVRRDGAWVPVEGLAVSPAYPNTSNGVVYESYDLSFTPALGDGVRIVGRPGGSARFVSVAELRAFSASPAYADGPLPAPWVGADVGDGTRAAGQSGYDAGTFVLRGGGDVWGDFDRFHFVSQPLPSDGTLTARLVSLAGANSWAKAGLMVRASSAPNAPHAMLIGTSSHGVHLQSRASAGADTEWIPGPAAPVPAWLRVQRSGNVVSASVSEDGRAWQAIGSAAVALGSEARIGLMATSTDYSGRNDVATAVFTDVTLTQSEASGPLADVTAQGTPVALVLNPTGGGSRSLAVIRDGIVPGPPTVFPSDLGALQYDTFTGAGAARALDWIGYTFAEPQRFGEVVFTEGAHFSDGGFFETLGVEVRQRGTWRAVSGLAASPTYPGRNDGRHFDTYRLAFAPITGDGVRIVGRPGGSARFVSVAELRVLAVAEGSGALPEGWVGADVGGPRAAGRSSFRDGRFTLHGGGDVWGDFDRFHFVSHPLSGDGTITARLDAASGVNPWAKMGLMIRASARGDAPYALVLGTPGRGVHVHSRASGGVEAVSVSGPPEQTAPVWLRLRRQGDEFTASMSPDGQTWALLGQVTVAMPAQVQIGLMATSTDFTGRNDVAEVTFSSVALSQLIGPDLLPPALVAAPPAFGVDGVFPNPARGLSHVRVGISEPGTYRVEVVDLLGRQVAAHTLREDAAAVRVLPVDFRGHAPGLYVVRVQQDETGALATGRVTVVR